MNPITMKLVVDDLILQALREDITFEDVSTASVCPTARPATVELIAKADGIIAGLDVFARTFELLDSQSSVLFDVADGDEVHAGDHVGQVRGDVRRAQARQPAPRPATRRYACTRRRGGPRPETRAGCWKPGDSCRERRCRPSRPRRRARASRCGRPCRPTRRP